jgi:hypothetical protein
MKRIVQLVITAAILAVLMSCSSYRHQQWRDERTGKEDNQHYSLRFIEADDEGWFWDPQQANDSMHLIRSKLEKKQTLVVVFVHGWHHSAQCCDQNVEGFRNTLQQLSGMVKDFDIVGIYVGWRGRSLAGWLDYFTFWGRKSAAERVGQNDLKEFLARLHDLYVEYRPDVCVQNQQPKCEEMGPPPKPKYFMGLISMGHSFGAQVLLRAISGSMEDRLQHLNPQPAYLHSAQPAVPDPSVEHSVTGVGDLIVLINPAAEASQYHRLHMLSRGLTYSQYQSPVMLVLSSENDWARHRLFTFGRWLGEIFTGKPRKQDDVERTVERQALGVFPGHITHQLHPVDPNMKLENQPVPRIADNCHCDANETIEWLKWKSPPQVTKPDSISPDDPNLRTFDFSGDVILNGVELSPLTPKDIATDERWKNHSPALPYQPFIVATTSSSIIDKHSGIFTDPFLNFLVPYIAYIEKKSLMNVEQNVKVRQESEQAIQRSKK